MLDTTAKVIAVVLGVHIVAKFAFFALPYRRRRAAIDKQYGEKARDSDASDLALLTLAVVVFGLVAVL